MKEANKQPPKSQQSFGQKIKSLVGTLGEKIIGPGTLENLKAEGKEGNQKTKSRAKGIGKLGVLGIGAALGVVVGVMLGLAPILIIALAAAGMFGAQQMKSIGKNSSQRSDDRLKEAEKLKKEPGQANNKATELEKSASKKKKMAIAAGIGGIAAFMFLGPIGLVGIAIAGLIFKKSRNNSKKAKDFRELSNAKTDQEKDAALVKLGIIKEKDLERRNLANKQQPKAAVPEVQAERESQSMVREPHPGELSSIRNSLIGSKMNTEKKESQFEGRRNQGRQQRLSL